MTRTIATAAAALLLGLVEGPVSTAAAQSPARTPASAGPAAPSRPAAAPPAATPSAAAPPAAARPAPAGEERPGEGAGRGGEVIARVGTSELTADEVRATVASLDERQQAALARDPALLGQTVRALLANRLVLQEALAKKFDQQPKIAAQLERARENLIIESYLQSLTTPPADYPGEAEIKSVYDANAGALMAPRRFRLAQIFIAVPKDADKAGEDAARRKLDEVTRKLRQPGADFAALAKSDSDDADGAAKGGELGWVADADLKPEIGRQVVGLAKGGVSEPVRLDDGWHILKLVDTEAAHTRPLAEVRDLLIQRIRAERAEAARRALIAELLKQSPPAINELALSRLLDTKAGR